METERHLRSTRRSARAAMLWERLWPKLLPALGVVALFLALSWFGVWPMLVDGARIAVVAVLAVAFVVALWPLKGLRMPNDTEADTRIETRSGLAHRPVTAQSDTLSTEQPDDPFAAALWREHRARMARGLDSLSPGTPAPPVAERDPFALRAVAGLVLFIAAAAGFGDWGSRIGDAFRSHEAAQAVAAGRIDAWVTPPAYTNRPPVYLDLAEVANGEAITTSVPEGSAFVVRATELSDATLVRDENGLARALEPDENNAAAWTTVLEDSAPVTLRSGETEIARFAFEIIPDDPPSIVFAEDPEGANRGALEFAYEVADDYGVASARADITPLDNVSPNAAPLIEAPKVPLPLPRRRAKEGKSKTSRDLSAHPWAGARVSMRLTAVDDAGQEGTSETREFVLPERVFTKPLARALVFERRRLAQDIHNRLSVASMLDIITTTHPDEFIENISHYTAIRVAYRMVSRNTTPEPLRDALDLLWETALAIEDGDLSEAERRLRDAQENLADALENGASDEEIDELMAELREAMDAFMRELAEKMQQQPNQQTLNDPNMQELRTRDLDEMMSRIEDLAKSGSRDAARELLREMQRMMNNLQMAQPGQQQQQQDPMSEQMNKLGEMMREQQQLMDETFSMQRQQQQQQQRQQQQGQQQQGQQGERQQGENGQQPGQQGEQKPMTAEEFAEAMKQLQERQGELQKQMQEMQEAMRGLGMEPSEQLGEAGEAMGGAEQELGEGNTGNATGEQGRALQAMRDGAQQMMQNMQAQAGERGRQGERGQHGQQQGEDRDPLGRQSRSDGPQLGDDVDVPDEIDAQRAREILDAIRERLGETARPKLELEYLDRLLPGR